MNKLFPHDFFASREKKSRPVAYLDQSKQSVVKRNDALPFNLPDASTSLIIAEQRLSSAHAQGN